jgi:hypothetical protein
MYPAGKQDSTVDGVLSSLGNSTGRNYFNSTELLVAMKCYLDYSEGHHTDGDRWITLAGFATSDAAWTIFKKVEQDAVGAIPHCAIHPHVPDFFRDRPF